MGTHDDVLVARIVAFIIDNILVSIAALIVTFVFGAIGVASGSELFGTLIFLVLLPMLFVIQFGYFIYLEGDRGQTLGKQMMGIVVVKEDGSPIDFGEAAIRNLLRIIDQLGIIIPYLVGLILMLVSDRKQRLGDMVADTVVVKAE
jgi:uncharacterized RDD family membrane protein YckC